MAAWMSFLLQTVILTFLILLFGEILPKLIANSDNMRWIRFALGGVKLMMAVFSPISSLLVRGSTIVNRVVVKKESDVTAEELSQALEITDVSAGDEKEMLEGILRFGDKTANEVMTPRVDMTCVDLSSDFDEVMSTVVESGYSRLLSVRWFAGRHQGVLYSRDLLPYIGKDAADFDWRTLLREPYFVPETAFDRRPAGGFPAPSYTHGDRDRRIRRHSGTRDPGGCA